MAEPSTSTLQEARFRAAVETFSAIGDNDPAKVDDHGELIPRQIAEARRLSYWIGRLENQPSPALSLAIHCQHLRRWAYDRSAFPKGRTGYLAWRKDAASKSAEEAARILAGLGFERSLIEHVVRIVTKQGIKTDRDVQTMEDALCLSFLEIDAAAFAQKHAEVETLRVLRRTWSKMSEAGRQLALELTLDPRVQDLLTRALDG